MRVVHTAMFLSAIRSLCVGKKPSVPVEQVWLDGAHWIATGACAYFTDPDNGQRYRVSVEPITEGA